MKENILIFGDSYSTYKGFVSDGYPAYYPKADSWDVNDVSHTWWGMLAGEMNYDIAMNNSWSGSTICNTGYSGDCSATSSFIHRLDELIQNGFFAENKIDRVFVFGGTNDSWTGNRCGELMFSDWTAADLLLILPGISYFLNKLQDVVSKEKIHVIVNTDLRPEVQSGLVDICRHYHIHYTLLEDIEKIEGHPTYCGMTAIKNQVISDLHSR